MDTAAVGAGADLFDGAPQDAATTQFLSNPGHHLLFAYDDAERVVGMVSGVETTHPDKGTEMFLYELSVAPPARGGGVATALVRALATLARHRGCYGMWGWHGLGQHGCVCHVSPCGGAGGGAFRDVDLGLHDGGVNEPAHVVRPASGSATV